MRLLVGLADLLYDAFVFLRNLAVSLFAPRPMYVLLEISGGLPEHRTRIVWPFRRPQTLDDIRRQLQIIGENRRVAGVVITVHGLEAGLASIQSLRGALAAYRGRGGKVVAFLPQASMRQYYLASIADIVVMPESGTLDLTGMALEVTFFKDALDRLGVTGEFEQIAEYKSAIEPYTRRTMSEPMREALNAVLDSVFDDVVGDIATARRLDPGAVRALINRAPLGAKDAHEAGLIDALLFEDELPRHLAVEGRRLPTILPWRLARKRLRQPFRWRVPGRAVAVISVRGPILIGESRSRPLTPLPLLEGETTGHATVTRAIRSVERNPLFGAIVLSIDSPGGSAIASDLIWREVVRAGLRKPVVAFLGNVAASGGYYVAAGAKKIVSQPSTLTGSIGVIAGKFNVQDLAERAGVHREILARGEAATITSPFARLSPDERRRLRAQAEDVYDRFVSRVAAGRELSREDVAAVAKGRVWTGRQAQRHGLVDALGDFSTAVDTAKELMGVPKSRVVPVVFVRAPRAVPLDGRRLLAWADFAQLLEERALVLMPWSLSLR
jgi:protease-4